MQNKDYIISKTLSHIDLNAESCVCTPLTFWCRTVHSKYEMWNQNPHSHTFWELHLCLSGTCTIESQDKIHTLTEGIFFLIPPSFTHTVLSQSKDFSKFVWGFSVPDKEVEHALLSAFSALSAQKASSRILSSVDSILENTAQQEYGFHSVIKSQLSAIFLTFVRMADFESPKQKYQKTYSEEMAQITEYIRGNLSAGLSAEDVSSAFFVGKGHIERLCKSEYGMTLSELKRKLQTETIRTLLQETELSMDDIARRTGFSDRYSMGKFFKKTEGMPPVQYRKSLRK